MGSRTKKTMDDMYSVECPVAVGDCGHLGVPYPPFIHEVEAYRKPWLGLVAVKQTGSLTE